MTESERIDFLIRVMEGGNTSAFAKRIGISKAQMSRIRKGEFGFSKHINTILLLYPHVNRHWLETGDGYPGDLTVDLVKAHYQAKLRRSELIIDRLLKRIEELEKGQVI